MYTEISTKVFVELFDLKDENILSLFLRFLVQKNVEPRTLKTEDKT